MYQPPPPPPTSLVQRVALSFSCSGLIDKDLTSKSDPLIAVYLQDRAEHYHEIGRTEKIENNHNPEFVKTVEVDYRFEEVQKVKFLVYDVDNETVDLADDDFLGKLECNLGQIVSRHVFTQPLTCRTKGKNAGTITVTADEVGAGGDQFIHFSFSGQNLDKKDFLSLSDPYLEISKDKGDGTYKAVHRTEYINDTLNPTWKTFTISLQQLCNCNYDTKIKIACYDYDDDGGHDLIGSFETTMAEMSKGVDTKLQWECINPKKQKKKKGYKNSGIIVLNKIKVVKKSSFLDIITSGVQINFSVGIDFTASNGKLHDYNDTTGPNEYVRALVAVGEVCQDYDTDKMFPALGFGCKIPPNYQVSFEFPLNFNPSNPYCQGIPGIVAAYQTCVRQIQMYGPTNVAPIINHVARFTQTMLQQYGNKNYFILLLLTDGVITDMEQTVAAIVDASYLPMSLIIVGVGNANFDAMDFLDCDKGLLKSSRGKQAMRDIVQFVPYRDYKQAHPAELAKAVLAEVPKQVCEFFDLIEAGKTP